jgi:hypothetical protein
MILTAFHIFGVLKFLAASPVPTVLKHYMAPDIALMLPLHNITSMAPVPLLQVRPLFALLNTSFLKAIIVNKMCYSPKLLALNKSVSFDHTTAPIHTRMRAQNVDATSQLWHQRLRHIGDAKLYAPHHY